MRKSGRAGGGLEALEPADELPGLVIEMGGMKGGGPSSSGGSGGVHCWTGCVLLLLLRVVVVVVGGGEGVGGEGFG